MSHRWLWNLRIIGGLCLLGGLVSCSPPTTLPAPLLPKFTPTVITAPTPHAPQQPALTATSGPCPPRRAAPTPTLPAEFSAYGEALRGYLADGGDPAQLPAILGGWQALPPNGAVMTQADVTGDGVVDMAVSLINPTLAPPDSEAALILYTCQEGTVHTRYTYHPGEWFSLNLIGARDLTADGIAELVFSETTCGAHTCWDTLHVWAWNNADFVERMGTDFMSPYATFYLEAEQIAVSSFGIGSVGAGPQRPLTTTLAWNGQVITVTGAAIGPAVYRYHAFRDGDEALFSGNDARATQAYHQVLTDNELLAWDAFLSREEERLWFNALAHWRLLVQATRAGDADTAQIHHTQLINDFPPGQAGSPVTTLAQRFQASFEENQNMAYACQAALDAPETQTVLDFLNSFGYANPVYERDDLCPFAIP